MDNMQMTQAEIAKAGVARLPDFEEIPVWNSPSISKIDFANKEARAEIVAALRLLEPVAAGTHVIVPKEPTIKMMQIVWNTEGQPCSNIYRAMITAAQEEKP